MKKKIEPAYMKGAQETLAAATVTYREVYAQRMEELHVDRLQRMREELAANNMDLNKVAPYPPSFGMGRSAYQIALAVHHNYKGAFESLPMDRSIPGNTDIARMLGKVPDFVKEKADIEAKIRKDARREAHSIFDGYIYKLAGKIGKVIQAAVMTGTLWSNCKLEVQCQDGEVQVWKTKCIVNRSIYNLFFNQWPTRRLS